MKFALAWLVLLLGIFAASPSTAFAGAPQPATAVAAEPIEVRMVIVTAFEIGADVGDTAGEFQAWAEEIPQVLPFDAGYRPLRYDPRRKLLLLMTGEGTNRAAGSTMALGLDPRFDLSKAYWMIAAIAGVNPNQASIGSAAWIGNVVDMDLAMMVDPREAPKGWPTGFFASATATPYAGKHPEDVSGNLFPTNPGLRNWAFSLTRGVSILDTPNLRKIRAGYPDYPAAQRPPFVLTGDEASGQIFWHGKLLNDHAERWVSYWNGGTAKFVMTAMEDTGVLASIRQLGKVGRADPRRVLVLRTASNYSLPPRGVDAATSLASETTGGGLSGLRESLDAAHIVGGKVVNEITGNWSKYKDTIPEM